MRRQEESAALQLSHHHLRSRQEVTSQTLSSSSFFKSGESPNVCALTTIKSRCAYFSCIIDFIAVLLYLGTNRRSYHEHESIKELNTQAMEGGTLTSHGDLSERRRDADSSNSE